MRVLVIGASGFMGTSAMLRFQATGHTVLGLRRSPVAERVQQTPSVQVLDYADTGALATLIQEWKPEVVLNATGAASVPVSFESPRQDFLSSVDCCSRILESVRLSGAHPAVVLLSSAAVYGNPGTLPVAEDCPSAPMSPYGFNKHCCELLGQQYANCFGMRLLAVRLFSVVGSLQRRLVAFEVFQKIQAPEGVVRIEGTGQETRDFLHVDDALDATLAAAIGLPPEAGFLALNVAAGVETSIEHMARLVLELSGSDKGLSAGSASRRGDPIRWRADISRLRSLVPGFSPLGLRDALQRCVTDWRN